MNFRKEQDMSAVQEQSVVIDALRVPMCIAVIFIHNSTSVVNLYDSDFSLLSCDGILNLLEIILSHILPYIAVPTFFLISGFLFFYNLQTWSLKSYKKKCRSRVKTLLIPYFLWNVTTFLFFLFYMVYSSGIDSALNFIGENNLHIFYDYNVWQTNDTSWIGSEQYMAAPFDFPLWFLRDLIVAVLLAPVISYLLHSMRIWGIALLGLAYISRVWIQVPGFGITSIFYFSLGAYFALNRLNLVSFSRRIKNVTVPLFCVLLLICTLLFDKYNAWEKNLEPIFVLCGVWTTFYIGSCIVRHRGLVPSKLLISSCFFIYAFHAAPIPGIGRPILFVQKMVHGMIPGESSFENLLCYVITPFITAAFCVFVFYILKRIVPRLTMLYSGNR